MSRSSDLWLIEYERVADDYTRNCKYYSEDTAEEMARLEVKKLGFDPHEIDEQISEIKA